MVGEHRAYPRPWADAPGRGESSTARACGERGPASGRRRGKSRMGSVCFSLCSDPGVLFWQSRTGEDAATASFPLAVRGPFLHGLWLLTPDSCHSGFLQPKNPRATPRPLQLHLRCAQTQSLIFKEIQILMGLSVGWVPGATYHSAAKPQRRESLRTNTHQALSHTLGNISSSSYGIWVTLLVMERWKFECCFDMERGSLHEFWESSLPWDLFSYLLSLVGKEHPFPPLGFWNQNVNSDRDSCDPRETQLLSCWEVPVLVPRSWKSWTGSIKG